MSLTLWQGHWVGLFRERLPGCSCLYSSYFIASWHFTTAFLSVGYFVSSGILSLLPCGFLTSTCFKIPCRTLSKNVRPGGVTADTRCVPQLIGIAAHSGFSAFSKLLVPCHWYQPVVLNHGWLCSSCHRPFGSVWIHFWLLELGDATHRETWNAAKYSKIYMTAPKIEAYLSYNISRPGAETPWHGHTHAVNCQQCKVKNNNNYHWGWV